MTAFYNEIEPYAAEWMERLAAAGHIANGIVDRRSVRDLAAADLDGYTQCHFFAGLGGWSYALRLAGWPDDREVWTGSCPCQPFSSAGKRGGFADDRHLWPAWFKLIKERRPPVIFGEQVASPAGLAWLDAVQADLEGAGYAVGAADLCAAGVGAPHIRQRLYFVAYAQRDERRQISEIVGGRGSGSGAQVLEQRPERGRPVGLADTERSGSGARRPGEALRTTPIEPDRHGAIGKLGHASGAGSQERPIADERRGVVRLEGQAVAASVDWRDCDWLPCRDGKYRPVEPGTFPLAHGVPARVGKLRAYGNAIVGEVGAAFVSAVMEIL